MAGLVAFKQGKSNLSQQMMRTRVMLQGATVLLMAGSSGKRPGLGATPPGGGGGCSAGQLTLFLDVAAAGYYALQSSQEAVEKARST